MEEPNTLQMTDSSGQTLAICQEADLNNTTAVPPRAPLLFAVNFQDWVEVQ